IATANAIEGIDATIVRAHQHAAGAKGGAKMRRSSVRAAARAQRSARACVDGLGNPVRFILTAGNVNDILQAQELIRGLSFDKLLADKGMIPTAFAPVLLRSVPRP